ncbi:hypothetical protein C356_06750 [Cryptococcus neoformans c45]|nr:hypothetical protein C356_06750 [Cryptococcus neoformans var. grubii c45]
MSRDAVTNAAGTVEPTFLHQVFIQSLLSRRVVSEAIALELYKRAVAAVRAYDRQFNPPYAISGHGVASFVTDVSTLLHSVSLEVIRTIDQRSNRVFFVLRNLDASEVASLATDLNSMEVEYLRNLIESIVVSYPANSLAIGQARDVINDSPLTQHKMTKSHAESLLDALVSRGWLYKSKRTRFSLGVRALAELETYLKNEFDQYVKSCAQCRRVVTEGLACSNEGCDCHIHNSCYARNIQQLANPACPSCSSSFRDLAPKPVGEKAVSTMEDNFKGGRKRKGKGKNVNDGNDEDEEEEGDSSEAEDELDEQRESHSQTHGSIRRSYVPETQYDEEPSTRSAGSSKRTRRG